MVFGRSKLERSSFGKHRNPPLAPPCKGGELCDALCPYRNAVYAGESVVDAVEKSLME